MCRRYINNKSTGDSSVFTFITGIITSAVWLKYGLLTNERSLIIVNSIGVASMFGYTLIFYLFTVRKRETLKALSFSSMFLIIIFFYISIQTDRLKAAEIVGFIGIGVSLAFFASPLTNLAHVIKVKNSESLPFSMILSSFIVTLLWFVYGEIINDPFIQIPNFIGCVLLVIQLLLFAVYPSKSVKISNSGHTYKPLDLL